MAASNTVSVLWWLPSIILIGIALFLTLELCRSGKGISFSRGIWYIASGLYAVLGIIAVLAASFSIFIGLFGILMVLIFGIPIPSLQLAASATFLLWGLGIAAIVGAGLSIYALQKIRTGIQGWVAILFILSVLGLVFAIINLSIAPCLINCPVSNNGFSLNTGGSPLSLGIAQIAFSVVLGLSAAVLSRSKEAA